MRSQPPERAQTAGVKDLYMTAGQFLGEELNGTENANSAERGGSQWKNILER